MNYSTIVVDKEDSRIVVRVYFACTIENEIKAILLVGPEQSCKGVFANMNTGSALITVNGNYAKRCDFRYTRRHHPLPCKWCAMMVMSKDPRCLWNDDAAGLVAGMKRITETPFLEEWERFMRSKLIANGNLIKFKGKSPKGSFLNISTEELDAIVVDGIQRKTINLQGK